MHSGDIRVIGTEAGRFSNCGHFGAVREINKQTNNANGFSLFLLWRVCLQSLNFPSTVEFSNTNYNYGKIISRYKYVSQLDKAT